MKDDNEGHWLHFFIAIPIALAGSFALGIMLSSIHFALFDVQGFEAFKLNTSAFTFYTLLWMTGIIVWGSKKIVRILAITCIPIVFSLPLNHTLTTGEIDRFKQTSTSKPVDNRKTLKEYCSFYGNQIPLPSNAHCLTLSKAHVWKCDDGYIESGNACIKGTNNSKCNIKGNISYNSKTKVYYLPSCGKYNDVEINPVYGEKWFCSEQEAINAGFEKSYNCPGINYNLDSLYESQEDRQGKYLDYYEEEYHDDSYSDEEYSCGRGC